MPKATLSKLLAGMGKRLSRLSRQIDPGVPKKPSAFEVVRRQSASEWFSAKGDSTLRVEYPLDRNSVVFDVGGYMGDWSSNIYSRYCCNIHLFEIIPDYALHCERRFSKNPDICVHAFGLGESNQDIQVSVQADASSLFIRDDNDETVQGSIRDIVHYLESNHFERIHLMKINIEGGEYALLNRLLQSQWIRRIDDLQIQFHDVGLKTTEMINDIRKQLKKTHQQTYCYENLWENWHINHNQEE